jgi:hypothetical protein
MFTLSLINPVMTWKDEDMPALRELESAVVGTWLRHAELNDYAAGRAYAAAFQHYRARLRNHPPKPPDLSGLDLETFNALQKACEQLRASGAAPLKGMPEGDPKPVSQERLVEYLRELARSVERHTKFGGRRGYLEFVRSYLPDIER